MKDSLNVEAEKVLTIKSDVERMKNDWATQRTMWREEIGLMQTQIADLERQNAAIQTAIESDGGDLAKSVDLLTKKSAVLEAKIAAKNGAANDAETNRQKVAAEVFKDEAKAKQMADEMSAERDEAVREAAALGEKLKAAKAELAGIGGEAMESPSVTKALQARESLETQLKYLKAHSKEVERLDGDKQELKAKLSEAEDLMSSLQVQKQRIDSACDKGTRLRQQVLEDEKKKNWLMKVKLKTECDRVNSEKETLETLTKNCEAEER